MYRGASSIHSDVLAGQVFRQTCVLGWRDATTAFSAGDCSRLEVIEMDDGARRTSSPRPGSAAAARRRPLPPPSMAPSPLLVLHSAKTQLVVHCDATTAAAAAAAGQSSIVPGLQSAGPSRDTILFDVV